MSYHDLLPVEKWHTNMNTTGRDANSSEVGVVENKIKPLPYTKACGRIITSWKCKSIWWRLRFLFGGEITLTIITESPSPMAVSIGDTVGKDTREGAEKAGSSFPF